MIQFTYHCYWLENFFGAQFSLRHHLLNLYHLCYHCGFSTHQSFWLVNLTLLYLSIISQWTLLLYIAEKLTTDFYNPYPENITKRLRKIKFPTFLRFLMSEIYINSPTLNMVHWKQSTSSCHVIYVYTCVLDYEYLWRIWSADHCGQWEDSIEGTGLVSARLTSTEM